MKKHIKYQFNLESSYNYDDIVNLMVWLTQQEWTHCINFRDMDIVFPDDESITFFQLKYGHMVTVQQIDELPLKR